MMALKKIGHKSADPLGIKVQLYHFRALCARQVQSVAHHSLGLVGDLVSAMEQAVRVGRRLIDQIDSSQFR